jgi:hypothetical protein
MASLPEEQTENKRANFYIIDNELNTNYAERIGPNGLAVYGVLVKYTFNGKTCFPSQDTIAKETGIRSRHTIIKTLDILKAEGLITFEGARRIQGGPFGGRFTVTLYTLLPIRKDSPCALNAHGPRALDAHGPRALDAQEQDSIINNTYLEENKNKQPDRAYEDPAPEVVGFVSSISKELKEQPAAVEPLPTVETPKPEPEPEPETETPRSWLEQQIETLIGNAPRGEREKAAALAWPGLSPEQAVAVWRDTQTAFERGQITKSPYVYADGIRRNKERQGWPQLATATADPYADIPSRVDNLAVEDLPSRTIHTGHSDDGFDLLRKELHQDMNLPFHTFKRTQIVLQGKVGEHHYMVGVPLYTGAVEMLNAGRYNKHLLRILDQLSVAYHEGQTVTIEFFSTLAAGSYVLADRRPAAIYAMAAD